jgi:hypothetical protein
MWQPNSINEPSCNSTVSFEYTFNHTIRPLQCNAVKDMCLRIHTHGEYYEKHVFRSVSRDIIASIQSVFPKLSLPYSIHENTQHIAYTDVQIDAI